jgi:hypothetical protein
MFKRFEDCQGPGPAQNTEGSNIVPEVGAHEAGAITGTFVGLAGFLATMGFIKTNSQELIMSVGLIEVIGGAYVGYTLGKSFDKGVLGKLSHVITAKLAARNLQAECQDFPNRQLDGSALDGDGGADGGPVE